MPKLTSHAKRVNAFLGGKSNAMQRLKAMRVVVPNKRFSKTISSNSVSGVIRGVATAGSTAAEVKNFDNNVAATLVGTAAPYILSLTAGIAEGTANNQRVGQKILLKSVELEINAFISNANTLSNFMDFFLVWDKAPDGATTTVATILATSATNLTFGNTANLERFVILRRLRLEFDAASNFGYIGNIHLPLDLATRFSDTTGAPVSNDILVVAVSPQAAGAATSPSIAYVARVKYTDA